MQNPLMTTFRAYEAISQRGKGGVYRALDLTVRPARLCLLKEGRRHGETDFFDRDGRWRVRHEHQVLVSLRRAGIDVPNVYDSFEIDGHYYLVTEFIEGETLQKVIKTRRYSRATALAYARQITGLIVAIHAAGWVWRDCKPLNLIASNEGKLRPVDFEGACRLSVIDPMPWGTPGYVCPRPANDMHPSHVTEDLYALGATLYYIFTRRAPSPNRLPRLTTNSNVRLPRAIREITTALLDPDANGRPSMRIVYDVMKAVA